MFASTADNREKPVVRNGRIGLVEPTGRRVRALVVHDGALLGTLPPFEVTSPWWSDVEPVAAELDRRLGARTAVLRMVTATGIGMRGGTTIASGHSRRACRPFIAVRTPRALAS